MTLQNRQLNLSQVCVDLHIQPNLYNERSCALGHSLVEGIDATSDPTVYHVPLTAGSTEKCRVILHETPYGRAHALTACSCEDWQIHHCDGIPDGSGQRCMSSAWICPHGAAVLLMLGRSDIYLDFVSLPELPLVPMVEAPSPVPPCPLRETRDGILAERDLRSGQIVEMDFGLDRRRFFAAFGKKYIYRWALLGIDKDMAMEAYRLRFGTDSLSKLKQCDWAIAAAEVQSATRSDMIMIDRAAEIKATLLPLLSTKEAA